MQDRVSTGLRRGAIDNPHAVVFSGYFCREEGTVVSSVEARN